jgi:hypothetical protein
MSRFKRVKTAVIGSGAISRAYLDNITLFFSPDNSCIQI